MIFAAGKGTRMGALTKDRPKPLIQVAGRPLIKHAITMGQDAGFRRIVANVHYKPDPLEDLLRAAGVTVSDEKDRLLETGGGLKAALPLLGAGPIATLNADAVWTGDNALRALRDRWDPRQRALLALVPKDRAQGHTGDGDFALSPEGTLSRGGPLVYTGAQCLDPGALDQIGDTVFSLNRYWDLLARDTPLHGFVITGGWCDVGHPDAIQIAEQMLEADENVSPHG